MEVKMLASIFHSEVIEWNENNHFESSENIDLSSYQNNCLNKIPDLTDDIFREEYEKDQIIDCF